MQSAMFVRLVMVHMVYYIYAKYTDRQEMNRQYSLRSYATEDGFWSETALFKSHSAAL